jgi:hypothetical protein
MFSKKTCQRCGRKTSKSDSFCPTCGTPLKKGQRKDEFGMLGEDDSFEEVESLSNSLFGGMGGFGGGFMNKMISSTMKMLEKEMEKEMQDRGTKPQNSNINNNFPRTKIKLMINGKEINLNNNRMEGNAKEEKPKEKTIKFKKFSEEQVKKFSKLPRKEPKTDLKRIADKINYEIEIPGVNSKEKAYAKSIPLNLPIVNYAFSKGLLILEFQGN